MKRVSFIRCEMYLTYVPGFARPLSLSLDAMTTATRYGLSLRKIALRILIGEILILRGDPLSGRALIHAAIEAATRIGYQRALAHAHTALGG